MQHSHNISANACKGCADGSIVRCNVSVDGWLSECTDSGAYLSYQAYYDIGIVLPANIVFDRNNEVAFITSTAKPGVIYMGNNEPDTALTSCLVDQSTWKLYQCLQTGLENFIGIHEGNPFAVTIDKVKNTLYYPTIISESSDKVFKCGIDGMYADQDCTSPYSVSGKSYGASINNNIFYATESYNNRLTSQNTNGVISSVSIANPHGIAVNSVKNKLFVTGLNNTVTGCDIDGNGQISNCQNNESASGFSNPYALVTNNAGTYALIVNHDSNTVSHCDIGSDGKLSNCQNAIPTPISSCLVADSFSVEPLTETVFDPTNNKTLYYYDIKTRVVIKNICTTTQALQAWKLQFYSHTTSGALVNIYPLTAYVNGFNYFCAFSDIGNNLLQGTFSPADSMISPGQSLTLSSKTQVGQAIQNSYDYSAANSSMSLSYVLYH